MYHSPSPGELGATQDMEVCKPIVFIGKVVRIDYGFSLILALHITRGGWTQFKPHEKF